MSLRLRIKRFVGVRSQGHTELFRCQAREAKSLSAIFYPRFGIANTEGGSRVMRKCLTVKRSHLSKSWGRQCLSKLAQARLRKPAAEPLGEHALGELSESERAVAPAPIERSGVRASKEPEHDKNEQRQPPSVPPLPLSPLMDPQLIAARQRFRAPKPSPSGQPSAFARRLEKNAYGTRKSSCLY